MRNFLFAAALAQKEKKDCFGVLVICPKSTATKIEQQVESFRGEILCPEFYGHIQMAYYEDYLRILQESGSQSAVQLAQFLQERMSAVIQ